MDAPDKTPLYTPIRITGIIENAGNSTEAVSLSNGWHFEINNGNEYVPLPDIYQYDVGEHVVILSPGAKYYVSDYIGSMESVLNQEGVYELRIVLAGFGQCIPSYINKPYTLERDFSAPGMRAIYKCWQGKVYSEPVKIVVENPSSKDDLEVLEFVKSGKALNLLGATDDWSVRYPTRHNFSQSYGFLREKYPNNYYTFVAGLHFAAGSGNSHLLLKQLLELQPQNPLRKYALLDLAIEEINHNWPLDKNIESDLPASMKDFIKQYKGEFERFRQE
ncbi:hypothetical protein L0244_13365, partial [bacterium]|nr:hypothetical protein [bacterium]